MVKSDDVFFEINPNRFNYILELFKLSKDEFIALMNNGRKKDILRIEKLNNILEKKETINISFLKRMDKIFQRGVTWYISKRPLPDKKNSSIFFRKDTFNTELNLESKKLITSYEDLKFEIQILCKQINFEPKRILDSYDVSDNPKDIAKKIKKTFNEIECNLRDKKLISKSTNERDYLKNSMKILEKLNIFVFEHVDRKRRPEYKISFNGLFLSPNLIVLKRQQRYLRREIFTLIHELAHYLLNFEEIDDCVDIINSNEVEQWCNTFAYFFMLDEFEEEFNKLKYASYENNYYLAEIDNLCKKTYLSKFAFYTRLKIENKISFNEYIRIKTEISESIKKRETENRIKLQQELELAKEQGKKTFVQGPKEIKSSLFEEIVKINYFEGKIDELQLRYHLNIKPNKSVEEVIY